MLSTFLKPFSDLIRRSSVRLISSSETARSLRFSTSVTFRTICIRPLLVRAVENAMDSDDIAILKVVTEIQGHGEGELVAGAFINKPIRSGMVVLIDVGAFEVDASKTHDLLVHLTGGQVIAKDADNL